MLDPEFSIVLALARCGIAYEPPTNAYVHQLRRLARLESLNDKQRRRIQNLIDWHDSGRPEPIETIAPRGEQQAVEKPKTPFLPDWEE